MSSESQVLANRRNAQRSTGPKTEEGKEVVSQNAVKHGLSARRDVIRGEDIEEFERHREAMLDDLAPVGAMEAMLSQRIVSLSWRLIRAQRMQDAAIEALCANYVKGPCLHDILERVARTVGRTQEDRPGPDDELTLGLAVARDFSQERALERLLAYEGKIEGSLYKAMAELEKLRRMRRADNAAAQNKANSQAEGQRDKGTEAQRVPDTPAGQNKANLQAEGQRDKGTEAQREPDTPAGQNKANLPGPRVDGAAAQTATGSVPAGT
jgi:hypothetical protein